MVLNWFQECFFRGFAPFSAICSLSHLFSKIWERRKSGKLNSSGEKSHHHHHHQHNSSSSSTNEQRRRSNEIMDIDEMLESPLRNLDKRSPKRSGAALEETITLSPRMGSPGNERSTSEIIAEEEWRSFGGDDHHQSQNGIAR